MIHCSNHTPMRCTGLLTSSWRCRVLPPASAAQLTQTQPPLAYGQFSWNSVTWRKPYMPHIFIHNISNFENVKKKGYYCCSTLLMGPVVWLVTGLGFQIGKHGLEGVGTSRNQLDHCWKLAWKLALINTGYLDTAGTELYAPYVTIHVILYIVIVLFR